MNGLIFHYDVRSLQQTGTATKHAGVGSPKVFSLHSDVRVVFCPICPAVESVGSRTSHRNPNRIVKNQNKETSMKRTWILCIVGLLAVMVTASSRAQMTGGTEKAVAALEEQWLQSQKTNNPDLV